MAWLFEFAACLCQPVCLLISYQSAVCWNPLHNKLHFLGKFYQQVLCFSLRELLWGLQTLSQRPAVCQKDNMRGWRVLFANVSGSLQLFS